MFSLPGLPYNTFNPSQHLPIISSPLSSSPIRASASPPSPRNANSPGSHYFTLSPTPERTQNAISESPASGRGRKTNTTPFSKRPVKKNPLLQKSGVDDSRETRRKLFLRRVREDSEDKRWEARGGDDEMMRAICIGEQRRRMERQARDAQYVTDEEEFDFDLDNGEPMPQSNDRIAGDQELADEVARQEEEELEALLSMMDMQSSGQPSHELTMLSQEAAYGSDDDDYDTLFMEVLGSQEGLVSPLVTESQVESDMMDMS